MNTAWVILLMYILFLTRFIVPAAVQVSVRFQPCVFDPVADHLALSCDVSKEQEVQKAFETIQKNCGSITYLVNSAGINRFLLYVLS